MQGRFLFCINSGMETLSRIFKGILIKSFWFQALLCMVADTSANFFLIVMQAQGHFTLAQLALTGAGKYAIAAFIALIMQYLSQKQSKVFVMAMLVATGLSILYLMFVGVTLVGLVMASIVLGTVWAVRGLQISLTWSDVTNMDDRRESKAALALVMTLIPVLSSVALFASGWAADYSAELFFGLMVAAIALVMGFIIVFNPELPAKISFKAKLPLSVKALVAMGLLQNISHYALVYFVIPLTIFSYSGSMKATGTFIGIMVLAGMFASQQSEKDKAKVKATLLISLAAIIGAWALNDWLRDNALELSTQILLGGYMLLFVTQTAFRGLSAILENTPAIISAGILGMAIVRLVWGSADLLYFDTADISWVLIVSMIAFSLHLVCARFWSFGFVSRMSELAPDHDEKKSYLKLYVTLDFFTGLVGSVAVYVVASLSEAEHMNQLSGVLLLGSGVWLLIWYLVYHTITQRALIKESRIQLDNL